MHTDTWIIVPMYCEQEVINDVLNGLLKHFKHVVAVDDGSSDKTYEAASKTNATVLRHPLNLGQGAAIQTGLEYALLDQEAKYFVTFDADGQHRVEDAEKMLNVLRADDVDIVLGSRFLGNSKLPAKKKAFLKTTIFFRNLFAKTKLTDIHNGLRVFNRDVAARLDISMAGMAHASEIISRVGQYSFRFKEMPVTINYTVYSMSKGQPLVNSINILFELAATKQPRKRQ